MSSKIRLCSIVISIVVFVSALIGGGTYLIVRHINNTGAMTEGNYTSLGNILNSDGTNYNVSVVKSLLNALGNDLTSTRDSVALKTANANSPIVFQMGEVNGNAVNWEAVYQFGEYLTVWMTDNYTAEQYNSVDSTYTIKSQNLALLQEHINSSYASYNNYSAYTNYSQSVLRDITNAIYLDMVDDYPIMTDFVTSPKNANATWQKTQTEDIYAYRRNAESTTGGLTGWYAVAHHNSLDTYSGGYTGWDPTLWVTTDTPYNDEFWIPSYYEIYNSQNFEITSTNSYVGSNDGGLWGLTATDRAYDTTTLDGTTSISSLWLRSGFSNGAHLAVRLESGGVVASNNIRIAWGVRPACHISLKALKAVVPTTVTLNQQSGSGGTSSVEATGGLAMPAITVPTRAGYSFGGYYTSANGGGTQYYTSTGASAITYPVDENSRPTVLYAKWIGNTYYVKYNANGGTGTMANSTHTYGTASALSANTFTRVGHTFSGWATTSTGTVAYADKANVSTLTTTSGGTFNLYAVWKVRTYTITVVSNDSSLGNVVGGGSYNYNAQATCYALPSTNCGFLYWADNKGTRYTANPLTITVTDDLTLTAVFSNGVTADTAIYATNGGEARMKGYDDNAEIVHFQAFAYSGYQFDGWYIYGQDEAISTSATVDLSINVVKNQIIIARFSAIS